MKPDEQIEVDRNLIPSPQDLDLCGERTGQGIRKRDPEKYEAIARALKNGLSLRQCAEVFGISKNTAGAICIRELGRDGVRKVTERNLRLLANTAAADLLEDMDKISPTQMALKADQKASEPEQESKPISPGRGGKTFTSLMGERLGAAN